MPLKEISVDEVYKNDDKLKREDVKVLMNWMEKQPHLPKATELQIALFLHSCYYSNEKAKQVIDAHFSMKTLCPELFKSRTFHDSSLKSTSECYLYTPLPKLTPSGDTVVISKLTNENVSKCYPSSQLKIMDIVTLLHLHQNGPMNGLQYVIDLQMLTLGFLLKVNPVVMKKFIYYLQEGMPIRLKQVHFINTVSFMDKIFGLIKPFMKKEIFDLLIIHTEIESLYKYIPQEILPEEYGGSCEPSTVLQEKINSQIANNEDFLKFLENQLADESKRQGPSKFNENLFGTDGSFKKLDID